MVDIRAEIREVTGEPLETNVAVIRRSFQTVADELGVTRENAPRFMAFMPVEQLGEMRDRGAVFYAPFQDGVQAGFVAAEREDDGIWWMRRLAVLPPYRGRGYARQLIERVIAYVQEHGVTALHIGVLNEQKGLKTWYEGMGFREYRSFRIPDHAFSVALLALDLNGRGREA